VADFIGDTNFLEGVVEGQEEDLVTVRVGDRLPVVVQATEGVHYPPGSQVTVAVRPEKVRLLPEPIRGPHNGFPCSVEQVVYVGTDTRFQVRISDTVVLTVREQNVISTPDPTAYFDDEAGSSYAVWLNDACQILTG
jgi:spermidine/putrescine transport system ATP-binding protein